MSGNARSAASATIACSSSTEAGATTASAVPGGFSVRSASHGSTSAVTCSLPTMRSRSATSDTAGLLVGAEAHGAELAHQRPGGQLQQRLDLALEDHDRVAGDAVCQ